MPEVKMKKVQSKCSSCGEVDEFEIPESGLERMSKGGSLVDAFPGLPIERIQQLANHLCPKCQKQGALPK